MAVPKFQNICFLLLACLALFYFCTNGFASSSSVNEFKGDFDPARRVAMVMLQIPKSATNSPETLANAEDDPLAKAYVKCIENHEKYCRKHGYKFIMERKNVSGRLAYWQKILSLARIMYDALENDTHDWLFWTDSDTLILNDEIELESYLPPDIPGLQDEENEVHVMMARDHKGWNNGVFFIRVHPWSLAYLLRTYTFPDYHPSFRSLEQSAMARLYEEFEDVRKHMVHVPMKWFNAYPSGKSVYNARQTDFQIHFPGDTNKGRMIDQVSPNYDDSENDHKRAQGPAENKMTVAEFWADLAENKSKRGKIYPHQ